MIRSTLIFSLCIGGSAHALAGRGQAPFVGVSPITSIPGPYDIKSTDTSEYVRDLLKQIQGVQQSDVAYVEDAIKALNEATDAYTRLLTVGPFKQLVDDSRAGVTAPERGVHQGRIDVARFLAAQNEVNEAKLRLENKLALLTSITDALPSDAVIGEGRTEQKITSPRRLDFSKITDAVKNAIARAEAAAQTYTFVLEFASGVIQVVKPGEALNVKLEAPLLTAAAIQDLQRRAKIKSTPSAKFDDGLTESHANLLKRSISSFVSAYGFEETYRFRDAALAEARANAFEQIVNGFWQRSYLRYVYGVRVGAILPTPYQKRWANVDRLTVLARSLSTFRGAAGPTQVTDDDLLRAIEDVRQKLGVVDARAAKILSGDASGLARLNSFLSTLRGARPSAEALLMILELVAADLKEEQMLATGGGLDELIPFYEARWTATDLARAGERARVCANDHLFNLQEGRPGCFQGGAAGGLRGVFAEMNDELNANAADLEEAARMRRQIRLAMLAQSMSGTGDVSGANARRGGRR